MDETFTVQQLLYVAFGLAAFVGSVYAIWHSQRKDVGDDRERLVRIETLLQQVVDDVTDIKGDAKSTNAMLSDHERRLIQLEASNDAMWKRCDDSRNDINKMIDMLKIGGSDD